MIDLLDIQEKIADTDAMIARMERLLMAHPGDQSLTLNLSSFHKRRRQLQAELAQASAEPRDQERTDLVEVGTLEGADAKNRTFHFTTDAGHSIRGQLALTIDPQHPVVVPGRYKATIVRTRHGQHQDLFDLTSLESLPSELSS